LITKLWNKIFEIFIKYLPMLSEPVEKKEFKPLLTLDLQLFAGDGDDDDDQDDDQDDDNDDDDEDGPNLDELLKDPKFKKQYQAKMKEQLGKRLKKYKDVDPEEYRRLKEQAGKGKKKDKDEDEDDTSNKKDVEKLLRAERREKRAAIKEFAVDNGHNQKLLARLIDVDAVELDEDGEPVNLDDLFDEIQEEFPEYFSEDEGDDEDEEEDKKKSKSKAKSKTFKPGSKQKGNTKKKVDVRARGAERAKARHKKEE
jgi:hypothetical protein